MYLHIYTHFRFSRIIVYSLLPSPLIAAVPLTPVASHSLHLSALTNLEVLMMQLSLLGTYNIRINWACRMESQIKHAIVVKVMGRTGSRGQMKTQKAMQSIQESLLTMRRSRIWVVTLGN
nr:40S ribosomal protein S28-1-like [Ipomoea batatas]